MLLDDQKVLQCGPSPLHTVYCRITV